MSAVGRSLIVDADGPPPREESVGDFTELPVALLRIGQPDPLVVPLLRRPHMVDVLGSAHLGREVLADEGRGLRSPDRFWRPCRGRSGPGVVDQCHGQRDHPKCDQENPPLVRGIGQRNGP